MTAKALHSRQAASRAVHSALDDLLPALEPDEVGGLAAALTELARQPRMLLKVFSFARTMAEDRGGGAAAIAPLRLIGGGHGDLIDVEEGARRLDAVTQAAPAEAWARSEVLGPQAVVKRLGVSRSTLHNWRRSARVIALRKGLRGHVYPMRQFSGGAPLPGVADTLARMTDPEEAWAWLVTPNAHTKDEPPLALLERGEVDAVRQAADSALDFA